MESFRAWGGLELRASGLRDLGIFKGLRVVRVLGVLTCKVSISPAPSAAWRPACPCSMSRLLRAWRGREGLGLLRIIGIAGISL